MELKLRLPDGFELSASVEKGDTLGAVLKRAAQGERDERLIGAALLRQGVAAELTRRVEELEVEDGAMFEVRFEF